MTKEQREHVIESIIEYKMMGMSEAAKNQFIIDTLRSSMEDWPDRALEEEYDEI